MNPQYKKEDITKYVISQLPDELWSYKETPITHLMDQWWISRGNSTNPNLRLTTRGKDAFDLAQIESYPVSFPKRPKTGQISWYAFMLDLGKKMPCPFYLAEKETMLVYDSKIAMMINLYGDVYDYVKQSKRVYWG